MKRLAATVVSGLVFGLGLTISDMINPAKVIAFLDVAGNWDPSLALVLLGATGVTTLTFKFILKRERPILDSNFCVPNSSDVNYKLIAGGAIFGSGWGIVGLCPGPAYTTLLLGRWETYVFFAAMIAGIAAYRFSNAFIVSD